MIETNSKNLERRIKRLIPGKFKMWFVRRLISPYMGRIVQAFCRKTLMGARFNLKSVDPVSAAKIYFGVWESAEIRFSKKYVAENDTIIELGSSVGVTLATLLSTKTVKKYIAVEASPTAARVLQETIKEFDAKIVEQVNGAISYSGEAFADFSETSFTGSRLSSLSKGTGSETSHRCPIFTLSEIIEKEIYPKTEYVLLTDIEGAEADIFVNDQAALKYCKKIICELDETEQYSVADQQAAIEKCGFKLAEFYGNVFVYCNEELAS